MEQIAVGAAAKVGSQLASEKLKEWVGYVRNYEKNRKNFKRFLDLLHNKQNDVQAWVEEGERKGEKVLDQVKDWQEWARDLLEELNGADDHALLVDKEAMKAADGCCFNHVPWNPKFRHHLSSMAVEKAQLIKERIHELDSLGKNVTRSTGPPSLGSAVMGSFCEALQSRQEAVRMVMRALEDENNNRIGIYGMGGAGKTTLATEVARRADNEKLFSTVVMVEINRIPNILLIQDRIAERIGLPLDGLHTIEERAMKLHARFKHLRSKSDQNKKEGDKLLLILDNLWMKQDLHHFGIYDDLKVDVGCKVVVTTRKEDVCKQMGASHDHIYKVGDLTIEEAELLFRTKVGETLSPEFEEIMRKLLKKCSLLPLSLSILADTVRNHDLTFWKQMHKNLESSGDGKFSEVLRETYAIIKLSYDNIESEETKRFFLLCCLFPPGSNIHLVKLLRYGIGLNLFQYTSSLGDAIDQTQIWANKLKSLSLLLDVDTEKGENGEIKIHDDVREAGKFIASKSKGDVYDFYVGRMPRWSDDNSFEKYNAITVVSDESKNYHSLSGLNLPNLQLLQLQGASDLKNNYFVRMQSIRVLDLSRSNIEFFPSSMEQLRSVKTLLLEGCKLGDISRIGKLFQLHVLSLRESNIKRLPREVGELVNLKILDLTWCGELKEIPAGILGNLTRLEGLYMEDSFNDWEIEGGNNMASISELNCCLSLEVLEVDIRSTQQLGKDNFLTKVVALSSFKISLGHSKIKYKDMMPFCPYNQREKDAVSDMSLHRSMKVKGVAAKDLMLDGWKNIGKKAESIFVCDVDGWGWKIHKRIPDLFFHNIRELQLSKIRGIEYALPVIETSKSLTVLRVHECHDMKYILYAPKTMDVITLPCLQEMTLTRLTSLMGLCNSKLADQGNPLRTLFTQKVRFPALKELNLESLGKIEELWGVQSSEEFNTSFPTLKRVHINYLHMLKYVWGRQIIYTRGSISSSSLEELSIYGCPSLKSVCSPSIVTYCLQLLKSLEIYYCRDMKQVIASQVIENDLTDLTEESYVNYCSGETICFPQLISMKLYDLNSMTHFYEGRLYVKFPLLKKLSMTYLESLKTFVKPDRGLQIASGNQDADEYDNTAEYGVTPKTLFLSAAEITFPSLQDLNLSYLRNIERIWDNDVQKVTCGNIPHLKNLYIYSCDSLKSVCPPSIVVGLEQLEMLVIEICSKLQQVVSTEKEEEGLNKVNTIQFSSLSSLKLQYLDNLKCFYQGSLKIAFPALRILLLESLGNFMAFSKSLKHCWNTAVDEHDWDERDDEDDPYEATVCALFSREEVCVIPPLEELIVGGLDKIEVIWDACTYEEMSLKLQKLEKLYISRMDKLRAAWRGATIRNLIGRWKGSDDEMIKYCEIVNRRDAVGVHQLELDYCRNYQTSIGTSVEFQALKELCISDLPMIKFVLQTGASRAGDVDGRSNNGKRKIGLFDKMFEFPWLEDLKIRDMDKLEGIIDDAQQREDSPVFPTLKRLELSSCPMMKYSIPASTVPKLSTLLVCYVPHLRFLHSRSTTSYHNGDELGVALITGSLSLLENLEVLDISSCESLEVLFEVTDNGDDDEIDDDDDDDEIDDDDDEIDDDDDDDEINVLPHLKTLKLSVLAKLEHIPFYILPDLQTVEITECPQLGKFLIDTASYMGKSGSGVLQQLEKLSITECHNLEAILGEEIMLQEQGINDVPDIELRQLKKIKLNGLLYMHALSAAGCNLRLPSLESLEFSECCNIGSFCFGEVETPKLTSIRIDDETIGMDTEESIDTILTRKLKENVKKRLKRYICEQVQFMRRTYLLVDSPGQNEHNLLDGAYMDGCTVCQFYCLTSNRHALDRNQFTTIPQQVTSQHHKHKMSHQLRLCRKKWSYICDVCHQHGSGWLYACFDSSVNYKCCFEVHPECVLDESLLSNCEKNHSQVANATASSIDQMPPPPEGWPMTVQHDLHLDCHPLKYRVGCTSECSVCGKFVERHSYRCSQCHFKAHSKCVLGERLDQESNKQDGASSESGPTTSGLLPEVQIHHQLS